VTNPSDPADPTERPIGWWARRLDGALESLLHRSLAAAGGDRRLWQVLHTLSEGPAAHGVVWSALEPFADSASGPQAAVAHLVADGLVSDVAGTLSLTEAGRERHDLLARQVEQDRAAVMDGLTDTDYLVAVRTLAVMVANAEAHARG
jgi:hypothetical protein